MSVHARKVLISFLACMALAAFIFSGEKFSVLEQRRGEGDNDVAMPPAMLSLMYVGDRFLAANIEFVRVTSSGRLADNGNLDFFSNLHSNVASLNPCHEDNYYIASAFLPWGGANEAALAILTQAAQCRFWDPWAAFMLGFNQLFFAHDVGSATRSMKDAALRAHGAEATFFSTLAVTVQASKFDDLGAALAYLRSERERAGDSSLKKSLDRRIGRLEGLAILRGAQRSYEKKYGRPLSHPQELLTSGLLTKFPDDPLGIGYEYRGQVFELRQLVPASQRK